MKLDSRSKKTTANAFSNILNKLVITICSFVVRTVLIKTLGEEYLGINGLFSSIISMLSLADLGIGIALPFSLYKPLADKDNEKLSALLHLYSKIYTVIGTVVLALGLALLPFIDDIIKGETTINNIKLIYALFVTNSAVSYFFIYKKTLIVADQKGYITNKITNIIKIILAIVQTIVLLLTKNYIFYYSMNIIFTLIENIIVHLKCNKLYPALKEKNYTKLDKKELKEIWKNSYALVFYKICNVVLGSTDNLLINYFCGVNTVGYYSNYVLIIDTIQGIINQIFSAITASVGNLVSTSSSKKSYKVFNTLSLLNFFVIGTCSLCLLFLTNDFIKIWIGEEYVLSTMLLIVAVVNYYLLGCQAITSAYRTAYGLFWQGRYRPVLAVIVNIVASIILGKYLGLVGILIGTSISRLSTLVWYDAYIVHKYGFKESVKPYYKRYGFFVLIFIAISMLYSIIFPRIVVTNYITFFLKAILIGIITVSILMILFYKHNDFKELINYFKNIINVRLKKEIKK